MKVAQTSVSLGLLAVLVTCCVLVGGVARNRSVERWLMAQSKEIAAREGTIFSNTGNFIDFEERVMLDEIPRTDFGRGGVYFFGSSNMKWAFQTSDLPGNEVRFIGNYGIGASNHADQLEFIKFLVESRGFLSAGDRDLLVFGVSYHLAHIFGGEEGYWTALLKRRGLFSVDSNGKIADVEMSTVRRWAVVEQARCAGLIWNVMHILKGRLALALGLTHRTAHDPEKYGRNWREYMGTDWAKNIDNAVAKFRETISFVRSRHARVWVVLLPQGTWMQGLPFPPRYDAAVRELCSEMEIPLIDLSRALDDVEFIDSNHLSPDGQREFLNLVLKEIRPHLRDLESSPAFQ